MVGPIQNSGTMSTEALAQMRERMFQRLDSDGNGQIELDQVQAEAEQAGRADSAHFQSFMEALTAADTDGDGIVSEAEFEQMEPPPPPPPERSEEESSGLLSEVDLQSMVLEAYSSTGETTTSAELTRSLIDLMG